MGPANKSFQQQFNIPGKEAFAANSQIAATYGNGGDAAPLVPAADWRPGGASAVSVIPTEDGNSPAGRATLDRVREAAKSTGADVVTGGEAAQSADFLDSVYGNFALVIALIAGLTFLLLARALRSLIIPLKAVVLNLLSVDADRRLRLPVRHLHGLPGVHPQPDARSA